VTRRLLVSLAAVGVSLVLAEAAVRLIVKGGLEEARQEREEFLAAIPGEGPVEGLRTDPDAPFRRAIRGVYQIHPFFGYTLVPGERRANAQGFASGVGDFPYRKRPRELVIGLFGGSVAMQLAAAPDAMLEPLRSALTARGWERVTLVSFAVDGWRQPQLFIALAYYLSMIDVAVVLDGHNEALQLANDELAVYPAAFPWPLCWGQLARGTYSRAEILRLANLIRAQERVVRTTHLFSDSALRHSMLAHLLWRVVAARYESEAAAVRRAEASVGRDQWSSTDPPPPDGGIAAKRDAYLSFYEGVIEDSHRMVTGHGKPYFHFIQPNQYFRGSKPLSADERRSRIRKSERFDLITPVYRRLEEATPRLRAAGVEFYFLGRIFAATPETVYRDECCHLNPHGVDLLGRAIAERMLASGKLDSVAPAL
jgi:hypothetical protein